MDNCFGLGNNNRKIGCIMRKSALQFPVGGHIFGDGSSGFEHANIAYMT